jgi:broad specificity phosphatase PhoE
MRTPGLLFAILSAALLAACATQPGGPSIQPSGSPTLEVVVVRHAEKLAEGGDPALSDAGRARAQRLAELLRDTPLVAAYSTDTQRARQTAKPSADEHGLAPTIYDPRVPPAEFVARLREMHPHGTVLVVGHSNTAPEIAAALCRCGVEPMAETEFDRVMRVRFAADGTARLSLDRD